MTTIDNVLMDMESNTLNAETVKTAVIQAMVREGIVSEEDANRFAHTHYVTILKDSWFKKLCKVLNVKDKDGYNFRVVRLVSDEEYQKYDEGE